MEVKQKGTPDMHVLIAGGTVAEGGAWVPGTVTTTQGPFFAYNNANVELAIVAAGATNPRVDTIIVRVYDDATDSTGKSESKFESLKGAEEPGCTLENLKGVAAVPKSSLVLGYVLVEAKVTSIVTAKILNVARPSGTGAGAWTAMESFGAKSEALSGGVTPGARIEGARIFLRGVIAPQVGQTLKKNDVLCTLPTGLRPLEGTQQPAVCREGGGEGASYLAPSAIVIETNGKISYAGNLTITRSVLPVGTISLDAMSFRLS
jgi:hypothetical protein